MHYPGRSFLNDGLISLDNNSAENAIRPFVAGRNYAQFEVVRSCPASNQR